MKQVKIDKRKIPKEVNLFFIFLLIGSMFAFLFFLFKKIYAIAILDGFLFLFFLWVWRYVFVKRIKNVRRTLIIITLLLFIFLPILFISNNYTQKYSAKLCEDNDGSYLYEYP